MAKAGSERIFRDREEAGRLLGEALERFRDERPIVLALPRGGVSVAFGVATRLGAPLEVILARKLGAPMHPELGMGAISEGGVTVLDETIVRLVGATREQIARITDREKQELRRRVALYREGRPLPEVRGRVVILVDDGIATGGTARAALRDLRNRQPGRLVLAAPVAAQDAVAALSAEADEVVCLETPAWFHAIGEWYQDFRQLSDEEVLDWLERARRAWVAANARPAPAWSQSARPEAPAVAPAVAPEAAPPAARPEAPAAARPEAEAPAAARPEAPAAARPEAPPPSATAPTGTGASAPRPAPPSPGAPARLQPLPAELTLHVGSLALDSTLHVPSANARGLVIFAHGSGSSRKSPRNRRVAETFERAGYATLLFDLLTPAEEATDSVTGRLRFDIDLLARRLVGVVDEVSRNVCLGSFPIALFGASTGAAAALVAAAERPNQVRTVVSRGGRPDLAGPALQRVRVPVLLIVGARDPAVAEINREALRALRPPSAIATVPGATHLFDEPGSLEEVARLGVEWLDLHLAPVPA